MKDIGKARRTRVRPPKPITWEVSVELPDSTGSQDEVEGTANEVSTRHQVNHVSFHTNEAYSQELIPNVTISSFSPFHQTIEGQQQENLHHMQQPTRQNLPSIYRLGGGRMDPFVRYPVEMDHRARQLIDHGIFLSSDSPVHKY